ncbi:MAG: hypothetical protein U5K69_00005 [Balneolaceae bacterium]|nr:hypothetical protein [Balneolaceae bacterium]
MPDILDTQQQILNEFQALSDWTERYKYIIELGRELPRSLKSIKLRITWSAVARHKYGCTPTLMTEILSLRQTAMRLLQRY